MLLTNIEKLIKSNISKLSVIADKIYFFYNTLIYIWFNFIEIEIINCWLCRKTKEEEVKILREGKI